MQKLTGTLSQLSGAKVAVIGDLILDTYTIGKARRISPEAPVAVLEVEKEDFKAGGAGNVALNLKSLGAKVTLVGRLGNESSSQMLKKSLSEEGISTNALFIEKNYQTPVKNRVIADNQQIVRIDHEKIFHLSKELEEEIIAKLPLLCQGVEAIAISDYGKGFLSIKLLRAISELAHQEDIPIIADPKGIDFTKYLGVTVLKPNTSEAYLAANLPKEAPLQDVAKKLLEITQAKALMITRSEAGISCFYKDKPQEDFPVQMKEVKDVTGAGDTVLAMLAIALASQLKISEAAQFCNLAAGIAIERFGCARVSLSDLARRLLELDYHNKVFDEEHLFALQEAVKDRKITLLGISGKNGLTTAIFNTIKEMTCGGHFDLIVYVRDVEPNEALVNVLASMQNVNFIILNTDSLRNLCSQIKPDEVYLLEEETLTKLEEAEKLLESV
ncbi:MAG TPA: bifunctional ADP-heptose synthase [Parachlamydiaceae bacterium]|nr:bifunctional ADP-heptose synthase [Parachlamydiaceae bacterium]